MSAIKVLLIILMISTGAAFIPLTTIECPSWDVRVTDRTERPLQGVTVRLYFKNYSAEWESHENNAITNVHGRVKFSPQSITASLGKRVAVILSSAPAGVHASFGPHAYVIAFGDGIEGHDVDNNTPIVWTGEFKHMDSHIIVGPKITVKGVTENYGDMTRLTRNEIPQLMEYVVSKDYLYAARLEALETIMELGPNDDQINELTSYVKRTLPKFKFGGDEMCFAIRRKFAQAYSQTGNDKFLQGDRSLFKAPECGRDCRRDILFILREIGTKENIPFFIDILNDSKSLETEKQVAAYGLGVAGSDYAIQRLTTMANYLFDRELKRDHLTSTMFAVHALQILAANRNEKANRTIQELAKKCCKYEKSKYVYQDYWWEMPFAALSMIGGDENRSFIESLSGGKCLNLRTNLTITQALVRWPSK